MTTPKDIDTFEKELEDRTKLCCALADKDEEIERLREEVKKSQKSLTWTVTDNERLLLKVNSLRDDLREAEAELSEAEKLLLRVRMIDGNGRLFCAIRDYFANKPRQPKEGER